MGVGFEPDSTVTASDLGRSFSNAGKSIQTCVAIGARLLLKNSMS